MINTVAISARIEVIADSLGVPVPVFDIRADMPPPDDLLAWCSRHGANLDFVLTGDLHPMIRHLARSRTTGS
jgi:hypothetical protein